MSKILKYTRWRWRLPPAKQRIYDDENINEAKKLSDILIKHRDEMLDKWADEFLANH